MMQQKGLERLRLNLHVFAKLQQGRHLAHRRHIGRAGLVQGRPGGPDQVVHLGAEHAANGLVKQAMALCLVLQMRILGKGGLPEVLKQRHRLQLLQGDQARAHAVVNIVRVVGNFIGQIAQLCLQAGLGPVQKPPPDTAGLGLFERLGVGARAVLENALARLEREVQAVKLGVAFFELIDHAQALQVVLEAAKCAHAVIERVLPGVAKRRVAQVVGQRNRLHQIFIERERARNGARQLRHLQRMRQPGTEQVAFVVQKHLGFVDQTPKRGAMNNAVAVALVLGAGRRGRLRKTPAARLGGITGKGGQHDHAQQASMTSRTRASGALRMAARPGPLITTKRISPPSAFLSTRMSSR